MKKLLSVLLCLMVILASMPAFAVTVTDVMTVVNCNDYVSLREKPDKSSTRLKKVHLGEFVTDCKYYNDEWVYCEFDGKYGFILSSYLKESQHTMSEGLLKNQMIVNCNEWVSLRKAPDTSSERLAKVPLYGVVTECVSYMGSWVMCTYKGKTGYIRSDYLKNADYDFIASLTPTPAVTAAPTATPVPVSPETITLLSYYMEVTNVSEWATMRDRASVNGAAIMRVPLGSIVENCEEADNGFVRCTFEGVRGYIRTDLLKDYSASVPQISKLGEKPDYGTLLSTGYTMLASSFSNKYSVLVQTEYTENGEALLAVCYNELMQPVWSVYETTNSLTELTQLSAFIAGTDEQPLLVIFKSGSGFAAYKIGAVKENAWLCVEYPAVNVSGSISTDVDVDGTIYAVGYYNSAPICIAPDGKVKWTAVNTNSAVYWPFTISITDYAIEVYYDSCYDTDDTCYCAKYSKDGAFINLSKVETSSIVTGIAY